LQRANEDHLEIMRHDGDILASLTTANITTYYKLPKREESFNTRWLITFNETAKDAKEILKLWW